MVHYLRWGKKEIHPRYGTEHYLVMGASGSGKSTLLNMLMKSLFDSDRKWRGVIYDSKQELLPYLYALAGTRPGRIKTLHPFDDRCSAWKLCEDIDGPLSARQFATILVPDGEGSSGAENFFLLAVRDMLTGVLLTFIKCLPYPNVWTFADVIRTMLYEPFLRFVLSLDRSLATEEKFPMTARLRESYLNGDPRTTSNIRATINARLSIYEPVAAVWEKAERAGNTFSLSQWVKDGCEEVLVLGNDEASRAALDPINQAIFKRACELVLARRELTKAEKASGENQTWFFLDEIREAGKLEGLGRLHTKGRSKGACIVTGFQDIEGLRDVYGTEVANEICGQYNNIAILKLNNPETAEWGVNLFGRRLATSESQSRSASSDGPVQRSREAGQEERPWVYTSDLLYLPPTSVQSGLYGYFRSPDVVPQDYDLRVHLDWQRDIAPYLPEPHPDVRQKEDVGQVSLYAASRMRPTAEHYLGPWEQADWTRLGFDTIVPQVISWQIEAEPDTEDTPPKTTSGSDKKPETRMPKNSRTRETTSVFASERMHPVDDIGR